MDRYWRLGFLIAWPNLQTVLWDSSTSWPSTSRSGDQPFDVKGPHQARQWAYTQVGEGQHHKELKAASGDARCPENGFYPRYPRRFHSTCHSHYSKRSKTGTAGKASRGCTCRVCACGRLSSQFPILFARLRKLGGRGEGEGGGGVKPFFSKKIQTLFYSPIHHMSKSHFMRRWTWTKKKKTVQTVVIEPVYYATDWCSQIFVVPNINRDVRICVEFTTLYTNVKRDMYDRPAVEATLSKISEAMLFSKLDANSVFHQIQSTARALNWARSLCPLDDRLFRDELVLCTICAFICKWFHPIKKS